MFKGLRHVRNVLQRGHFNLRRCQSNVTQRVHPNAVVFSPRQMMPPVLQPLSWRQVSTKAIQQQLLFTLIPLAQMKMLRSEYKAIVGVIARSLELTPREVQQLHLRCLNAKTPPNDKEKSDKNNNKPEKTSPSKSEETVNSSDSGSSTPGSGSSGEEPPPNPNNKNNENDEKMRSVLTKAVLWLFTIYMFVAFISLLITPRTERPEGSTRYVSWNEFVHHMLAVGEVKELIIRPDMEMVTIILHEGAVIKGRKVTSTIFHMAVADANKFEEKLRLVEKRLGIKEGVPVTYDRQTDTTGRILMLLLFCALLMSIATRMKSMKSPLSMDSFVSRPDRSHDSVPVISSCIHFVFFFFLL